MLIYKKAVYKKLADSQKVMYIMRGVSGSGKSTTARNLGAGGVVFSTDDYFSQEKGSYDFNPSKLGVAHDWNKDRAEQAVREGISPIVIDNTNTQAWEMQPYVEIAMNHGYRIKIVEPTSPWWKQFNPGMSKEELSELANTLYEKGTHGVPLFAIEKMLERWEHNVTPMQALRAKRPF